MNLAAVRERGASSGDVGHEGTGDAALRSRPEKCPARHHGGRGFRHRRRRGGGDRRRDDRLRRADGRAGAGRSRRGARSEGRLGHARPDRLPHAPGLWRQPLRRVRAAAPRRELCRDRRGGRRHTLDRRRHPRRVGGRALRGRGRAAESADGRGRHHDRDQVGLRARPRHRAQDAPRRAAARRVLPGDGGGDLSRRPHRPRRICRGCRRLCRSRLRG